MDHAIIVGPIPLTLAIVTAYGLLMKGVRARATIGRDTPGAIFHAVVGLLTIPVFMVLLYLWSFAMDLSLPWALLAWCAALVSGHACVDLAVKYQDSRADVSDLGCATDNF